MAYTTPAEVRMAIVPSSDGSIPNPASNTAADLSDAQLNDAIAEAGSMIDGFIGVYYAVPVQPIPTGNPTGEDGADASVPHPIDFWCRTVAAYLATLTFREGLDFTDSDPMARRYKDVMTALLAVSTGKMKLQIPSSTTTQGAGVAPAFNPYVGDLWDPSDFDLEPGVSPNLNPNGPAAIWQDLT